MTAHSASAASAGPCQVSPGGTYTINQIVAGCKIFIRRPGPDGKSEEERLAEILSIRDKPENAYARQNSQAPTKPEDKLEFFVHWDTFNKRLDDWVPGSRLVLTRELTWPPPQKVDPKAKKAPMTPKVPPGKAPPRGHQQDLLKRATSNAALAASPPPATPQFVGRYSPAPSPSPSVVPSKRKAPSERAEEEEDDDDDDADADGDADMDVDAEGEEGEGETFELNMDDATHGQPDPGQGLSKEEEIQTLRYRGSMTQSVSEVARMKNLNRLQIGRHEVDAWYFSPYPKEYAHLPVLYICEFCLSFFPSQMMLGRHRKRCTLMHPPGNEIYRHEDISFYEIDGKRQLTWCRNLSLLSKCFLDHKTLYYDVTPFLYYVMAQRDSTGCHMVGYFSKEKECAEGYNVACILTLPQHQRHGFGKLLIEFSYALSRKEKKAGSPEKPLSDLGLLGYRSYWAEVIVGYLMQCGDDVSIEEISNATFITQADVMNTCVTLGLFRHYKGQHRICLTPSIVEKYEKKLKKPRRRIHPECLQWTPPVFTREQLRFGW
ncbi:hypothetical protein K525DRAFT_260096 [Schizophyllum commune Loenen D]|nr:hypothetical protein K525DRAFT_260096 [Schizophyllum commune Loenen D]